MSWMDEELDDLFKEQASGHSFDYRDSYWKEFEEKHLNRRRDGGIWLTTAFFFTVCLLAGGVITSNQANKVENEIAHTSKSEELVLVDSKADKNLNIETSENQLIAEAFYVQNEHKRDIIKNVVSLKGEKPNRPTIGEKNADPDLRHVEAIEDEGFLKVNGNADHSIELNELEYKPASLAENSFSHDILPFKNYSPPKPFRIYAEGVMGVTQSMVKSSGLVSNNYGIGFGTVYNRGRFVARIGATGTIQNHSELLLTRSSKIYGFGSDQYKADIDYAQLYQIGVSASAGLRFGKNTISGGVNLKYLAMTKSYIYEYSVGSLNSMGPSYERTTVYNYMDGLNRLTAGVNIGVAREFSPGLEMGVNLGVQLINQFDNSVLLDLNNRPVNGQLYIRKTF